MYPIVHATDTCQHQLIRGSYVNQTSMAEFMLNDEENLGQEAWRMNIRAMEIWILVWVQMLDLWFQSCLWVNGWHLHVWFLVMYGWGAVYCLATFNHHASKTFCRNTAGTEWIRYFPPAGRLVVRSLPCVKVFSGKALIPLCPQCVNVYIE